jgi:carboxyl-terminal processing protease
MKKFLLWLVLALAASLQAAASDAVTSLPAELKPVQQQSEAAHVAAKLLTHYHYKTVPLDAAMSQKIFDNYLKSIDPQRVYFIQADIDRLAPLRPTLGDAILKEDLTDPFAIFNLYSQRAAERLTYARALLKDGFDFRQEETYQTDREKEPWVTTEAEMRELWRKRVKNDWLRLKLAGENDKNIVKTLDKRYGDALKRVVQINGKDVFQAFMNAYTTAIEPHTNYMGPRAAEDFDNSMKLSLVGIGALLEQKDDYCLIRELVPGGPAILSGELSVGDRILRVARNGNGAFTDIQGWRLDDAVALIRGTADTIVQLDILPASAGADGKHKLVSLVRKKISLEDQAAKKSVITVKDGSTTRRIGVISLPSFYEDFEARRRGDPEFRSAARDVARLLGELKTEKVDSVLIDLRNDGGGSLQEAIELTGLFVGKGPVLQERDAHGEVAVLQNSSGPAIAWDGPLGVLINRNSASASEIFAAAIQDYGRGLVIGARSFGKGTVQTVVNLDQAAKSTKQDFGELRMTVAQFFRINGGTTQLRGVEPDVVLPAVIDPDTFGESSFDNALPWLQVKPAIYSPVGDLKTLLPELRARHEARVKSDSDFQHLQEDIAEFKRERLQSQVSLNEIERRKERATQEARLSHRDPRSVAGNSNGGQVGQDLVGQDPAAANRRIRDDGLQAGERTLADELAAEKAGKSAKDVVLDEAAHVLGDEIGLLKAKSEFVARFNTAPAPALQQ